LVRVLLGLFSFFGGGRLGFGGSRRGAEGGRRLFSQGDGVKNLRSDRALVFDEIDGSDAIVTEGFLSKFSWVSGLPSSYKRRVRLNNAGPTPDLAHSAAPREGLLPSDSSNLSTSICMVTKDLSWLVSIGPAGAMRLPVRRRSHWYRCGRPHKNRALRRTTRASE